MKRAGVAFGILVGIAGIIGAIVAVQERYWPREKEVSPSVAPGPFSQLTPVLPPAPPPIPAPIEKIASEPKPAAPRHHRPRAKERDTMSDKKSDGDTVTSYGQSGGITAHTVTVEGAKK